MSLKHVSLGVSLVLATLGQVGCGRPESAETKEPGQIPGQLPGQVYDSITNGAQGGPLGLCLVKADPDDPALPSATGGELKQPFKGSLFQGSTLVLTQIIPFKGDETLYFVGAENALGPRIVSGSFYLRQQDSTNKLIREVKPVPTPIDAESGRWFIPLKQLLGETPDLTADVINLLHLSFNTEDGARHDFTVNFRVHTPIEPKLEPLGRLSLPVSAVAASLFSEGWEVASERLSNPSSRPLRVVFELGPNSVGLETAVEHHFGISGGDRAGPSEHTEIYKVAGSARISSFRVEDESGLSTVIQLGNRQGAFVLPGHSSRTIHWLVSMIPESRICALPAEVDRIFSWTTGHPHCAGHGENFECHDNTQSHDQTIAETSAIVGIQLKPDSAWRSITVYEKDQWETHQPLPALSNSRFELPAAMGDVAFDQIPWRGECNGYR